MFAKYVFCVMRMENRKQRRYQLGPEVLEIQTLAAGLALTVQIKHVNLFWKELSLHNQLTKISIKLQPKIYYYKKNIIQAICGVNILLKNLFYALNQSQDM